MADREKVIKAIEGCINISDYCNVCDYDGCVFNHGSCEKDLLADALELLKEQEDLGTELTNAVELIHKKNERIEKLLKEQEHKDRMFHALEDDWKRLKELLKEQEEVVHPEPSCEMTYITDCCCDLCGVQLIREDIFCRCCGKRIEWEGR